MPWISKQDHELWQRQADALFRKNAKLETFARRYRTLARAALRIPPRLLSVPISQALKTRLARLDAQAGFGRRKGRKT